jgi:sugar/nucleoside kinase (ribokinase family)
VAALVVKQKARIEERWTLCGGQTATFCCASAAFGLRTGYVGAFGADSGGALIRDALTAAGVDLSYTVDCDAPNREAVILLDTAGRRTVLWHRSDAVRVDRERMHKAVESSRLVHVDDDDADLAIAAATCARRRGLEITSDIEHVSDRTEELVAAVSYPIFDDGLPGQMTGEIDPERALRKLRRLNPGLLCMTLGDNGAAALDGDRFHVSDGFKVPVVDSTGAGDVFRAGFVYGLGRKWETAAILRFANAAGAAACTRLGAIAGVPSLQEVTRLLEP